jgi:hypothetical protein
MYTHGQGKTAYFPWPVDTLFYGHSLEECRSLLGAAVRRVAGSAQVETDLPPQVEVTVHTQSSSGALLVHLVNSSGHQDRSFHRAQPFFSHTISVRLPQGATVASAASSALGKDLPLEVVDGMARISLPRLDLLDLLVLTQ